MGKNRVVMSKDKPRMRAMMKVDYQHLRPSVMTGSRGLFELCRGNSGIV